MRAAKIDSNQNEIVQALRKVGATVILTHQLKNAFDCIVIYKGSIYLTEIKDGSLPPSKRKLTPGELKCKADVERAGAVYNVVESVKDAFLMLKIDLI